MHHILNHRHPSGRGFSLLELLLFVSLAAILTGALAVFLSLVMQSRVKQQTIVEVEEQGMHALAVMTRTIRNARSVVSPSVGVSAPALSLAGATTSTFDSANNQLWFTDGVNSPVAVTSTEVVVSNLQFLNLSRAQTPGVVRVQFTLSRLNPEGRNEYSYQQTFYGSAAVR